MLLLLLLLVVVITCSFVWAIALVMWRTSSLLDTLLLGQSTGSMNDLIPRHVFVDCPSSSPRINIIRRMDRFPSYLYRGVCWSFWISALCRQALPWWVDGPLHHPTHGTFPEPPVFRMTNDNATCGSTCRKDWNSWPWLIMRRCSASVPKARILWCTTYCISKWRWRVTQCFNSLFFGRLAPREIFQCCKSMVSCHLSSGTKCRVSRAIEELRGSEFYQWRHQDQDHGACNNGSILPFHGWSNSLWSRNRRRRRSDKNNGRMAVV